MAAGNPLDRGRLSALQKDARRVIAKNPVGITFRVRELLEEFERNFTASKTDFASGAVRKTQDEKLRRIAPQLMDELLKFPA